MQIHLRIFIKAVFQVCKAPETASLEDAKRIFLAAIRALGTLAFWNQDRMDWVVGSSRNTAIIKAYWGFL